MRCFSTGKRTALNRDVCQDKPELEKAHNDFKKIRDQHIAHPVGTHEHNELIIAAESEDYPAYGIGSYNFSFAGFSPQDLKRFLSLLRHVATHVEKEETRLGNELARKAIGPKSSWAKAQRAFSEVIAAERLYPTKRSKK